MLNNFSVFLKILNSLNNSLFIPIISNWVTKVEIIYELTWKFWEKNIIPNTTFQRWPRHPFSCHQNFTNFYKIDKRFKMQPNFFTFLFLFLINYTGTSKRTRRTRKNCEDNRIFIYFKRNLRKMLYSGHDVHTSVSE